MTIRLASPNEYPKHFPPQAWHVLPAAIESAVQAAFAELVENPSAGETEADNFLKRNPALLGQCLNFTNFGHHGTWVVPQKLVDPGANTVRKGKKPDYLLGGKNSDGFHWCVVELKSPNEKLFKKSASGVAFSATANEGICQLIQYIDYCSANQSFMRDHFKLNEFREPRGFLVLGREAELDQDPELQELRSAWNRLSGGRLMIRSYDAILRSNTSSWGQVEHGYHNEG
ncbi:Shedu anti-phage system protein SduA domain-containing protein [Xanthomonas euvesicatoria]|uniref:Shedu anti-phage system protein SduA domain-containing protein n=1 Tax=Xanthomonas TaxID=338 RepID=UPI003557ACE5